MSKERSARILVADDDPVSLQFLVAALRELGAEATGVASGSAALDACRSASFDVLLLDRRMPDLGGAPLLRELRRRGCTALAIATSAELDAAMRAELADAGYAEALAKPIGIDGLAAVLATPVSPARGSRADGRAPPRGHALSPPPMPLDDDGALASLGGSEETLHALRGLFATELETALPRIAAMPAAELGDWLHRLRASCRYCGATHLGEAAARLEVEWKRTGDLREGERCALIEAISSTLSALNAA